MRAVAPDEALQRLSALSGGLCHYNPAFLRANLEPGGGATLAVFTQEDGGALVAGAVGYERRGRLFSTLTLPTQPVVSPAAPHGGAELWQRIRSYCRGHRIATVSMHSFEGQALLEPPLGRVIRRTSREEFVLDPSDAPERLLAGFSENHRRNIRKAEKHGLAAEIVTAEAGADTHAAMFRQSMERRAARGEDVGLETDRARVRRLLAAGAGWLVQVRRDGTVLASLLILATATHAYYHSGGSAPDGMKLGASHFAMWRTIETLRDRGVRSLCLGGASERDSEGLTNFKLGFNPRRIALAHCVYAMELPLPWSALRVLLRR